MEGRSPDDPHLTYLPLSDVTTYPGRHARLYRNAWWVVHPERGVVLFSLNPFSDVFSPQCNDNETIARSLQEKLYPWAEVKQIELVILKDDPSWYH